MSDAYFDTSDGVWFRPTDHSRGPWEPDACHAGPPIGLMVRALEQLVPSQRLSRITVEIARPIPMVGFRVQAEIRRSGRSVTTSEAMILDNDRLYARSYAAHLRVRDPIEYSTTAVEAPRLADAVEGSFPVTKTRHGLSAFPDSVEVRYDPAGSQGTGGPTTIWMRTVPLLADEEPSGFQRLCPLADSGNGVSYNDYLDRVLFVNPDLTITVHREPTGEWFCSRVRSHWQPEGIGMSDAELFDTTGHLGRAVQTLLLEPV